MYPERLDLTTAWTTSRKVPTFFEGHEMYIDLPNDFIEKSWPDSERVFLSAAETKRWAKQNNTAKKYEERQRSAASREDAIDQAAADNIAAGASATAEDVLSAAAEAGVALEKELLKGLGTPDLEAEKVAAFGMLRDCIKQANVLCKELNCELTDDDGHHMLPTGFRELVFDVHKVV